MDLIYKIYSVYLYNDQLNHDYIFLYNRHRNFTGELSSDAPWEIKCALNDIHQIDKSHFSLHHKSIEIMEKACKRAGITFIKSSDLITLLPIGEGKVSYSGALPDDIIETECKYAGLKKNVYTPYNIMFNETKAGFNPHEFEVMGIWKAGNSQYSCYRIWEEVSERNKTIRDNKINSIL